MSKSYQNQPTRRASAPGLARQPRVDIRKALTFESRVQAYGGDSLDRPTISRHSISNATYINWPSRSTCSTTASPVFI